ncbi:MAG TPA: nuclear transport factor 2 family protein [Steroidobacteraceae bacterium]|nr:nuclear transport factor 2 family protein [Steroidobacteraceae bacterium]
MKRNTHGNLTAGVGCVVLAVAAALVGCAQQQSAPPVDTLAREQSQLALDRQDIQNLMSRRAFYHSAGRNDLEFALYANRPDISWGQNQGFRVGAASIKKDYVDDNIRNRTAELERLTRFYPQLKNDPGKVGAGIFVIHTLSTPVIEIAGDRQTAKGVWYTPGAIGMVDAKGKLTGDWLWERYAVDFIRENGAWRFWHILVLTDFLSPMGKDLQPPADAVAAAPVGTEGKGANKAQATAANGPAPWDITTQNYTSWAPTTVQALAPRLPEPYKTFSETFSYGPPADQLAR